AASRGEWWAPFRTRRLRAAATRALRVIGSPEALDVLRGLAASGPRGTQAAALAALSGAAPPATPLRAEGRADDADAAPPAIAETTPERSDS
ncbi:MAG: hypothetical protein ABI880_15660, partial [Acidobacteriota bacterium]